MKVFLQKKLITPLKNFLKTGMTPSKLAQGIAWGFVLGVIPFLGINTILCAGVAFIFRINMAVIQLVNYFVYPLQLLLFIPFIKLGIYVFGIGELPYPIESIWDRSQENFVATLGDIWLANVTGVFLWIVLAPLIYLVIYHLGKLGAEKLLTNEEK